MAEAAGVYSPVYFNRGIEDFIGFVAAFLLALVQKTPFRIQTLTALLLVFFTWLVLKRFLLAYVKKKSKWEKLWVEVLTKLFSFITTTLFFLLFYFSVFLLQHEFQLQNINVQEIITILLVFMLFLFTTFVLYKTRLRWNQPEYLTSQQQQRKKKSLAGLVSSRAAPTADDATAAEETS